MITLKDFIIYLRHEVIRCQKAESIENLHNVDRTLEILLQFLYTESNSRAATVIVDLQDYTRDVLNKTIWKSVPPTEEMIREAFKE